MFIILCGLFSLGQFHRSSGAVLAPVFTDAYGLSAAQVGFIVGGMFLMQGLMQLPSGILIDRFGVRLVLPCMVLIAVAGCSVISVSDGWPGLLLGRALLGVGFATSLMGPYTLFSRWGKPEIIATLTGRLLSIGGIGGMVATYPLAYAIETFDLHRVFMALGGATLLMAVMTYLVVRDLPVAVTPQMSGTPKSIRESVRGLVLVMKDRRLRPVLSIALFIYSPMQILIGVWAGPFLKDVHDVSAINRSYILLAMAAAMNVGTFCFGPLERLFNTRRNLVIASTGLISLMFLAVATFAYAHVGLVSVLFVLITLVGPFFIVLLAHNQLMFPVEYASRVISLINVLAISGIFVMQYVTGFVISLVTPADAAVTGTVLGYRLVFALMAVLFLVISLVYRRTTDIPPRS